MDIRPKRRKSNDNPYTLESDIKNNVYIVMFKDNKNEIHKISVNKEIYDEFNKNELKDISQMHEYERHIEHLELDDNTLYKRTSNMNNEVEKIVEQRILNDCIKNAIDELSEIQKRRFIKYYFENKTQQEIANEENASIRAVQYTLSSALEKIKKNFKF